MTAGRRRARPSRPRRVPNLVSLATPEGDAGYEEVGDGLDELVTRVADGCGIGRREALDAVRAALAPPEWAP